jgi:hypothetical protein
MLKGVNIDDNVFGYASPIESPGPAGAVAPDAP